MKKVFFVFAALLLMAAAIPANAAKKGGFDKKNIYVGGAVGYTKTSVTQNADADGQALPAPVTTDGSSIKLVVDFGYDLNKKNSLGAQVGYFSGLASMGSLDPLNFNEFLLAVGGAYADMTKGDNDVTGLRFAPFIRHILLSNKTFDIFVDGVIGIESLSIDMDQTDNNGAVTKIGQKYNLLEIVGRPGIALKLDKNFRIVTRFGSLGYQRLTSSMHVGNTKQDGTVEASRFGFSAASSGLLIGVEYHF